MISDYVGFQRHMLPEFTFSLSSKGFWKEQHSHYSVSNTPRSVFQTACIRELSVRSLPILFTMFYVCCKHLDQARCILFKMQGPVTFIYFSGVHG
jgi:hypothetical protein